MAALRPSYHPVALAAKQAATIQEIAQGRFTLNVVSAWWAEEARQYGISFADHSRQLSPFDPLLFAMLGSRSICLTRLGEYGEAADWAIKAAARPNAHQHIMAIAAFTLGLAGRVEEANVYKARIRERVPDYSVKDFLGAFRYSDDAAALFARGAKSIGMK